MSRNLCDACAQMQEVISGKGSRFLLCGLSHTDARFPKYPPQPVVQCTGFAPTNLEDDTVSGDAARQNTICLDQFLKLASIAESGGQAKVMIQGGHVLVNGALETRRRRKLAAEDVVEVDGSKWRVKDVVSLGT
jgi:ribosome-associated protein